MSFADDAEKTLEAIGGPLEIAAELIRLALQIVGKEEAQNILTREAVQLAETLADVAELAKFGPQGTDDQASPKPTDPKDSNDVS